MNKQITCPHCGDTYPDFDVAHVCSKGLHAPKLKENINAGADINAGDGGYSVGTKEKYDEFVNGRNQSLAKMRIRELAEQALKQPDTDHDGLTVFDNDELLNRILWIAGATRALKQALATTSTNIAYGMEEKNHD